jgi:hypothetical protein
MAPMSVGLSEAELSEMAPRSEHVANPAFIDQLLNQSNRFMTEYYFKAPKRTAKSVARLHTPDPVAERKQL